MDSGCDVDRLEVSLVLQDWRSTPLDSYQYLDSEADGNSLEKSLICRTHLLQAGADPTVESVGVFDVTESMSAVETTLGTSTAKFRITVSP